MTPSGVAKFDISDSALRQASLLSEWGKLGVNLVRVGGMYTSDEQWSEASCAQALKEFRFVADAAHAAGIYLIADLPIQAWGNALAGIPVRPGFVSCEYLHDVSMDLILVHNLADLKVNQANWTTAEDWERWTLGNMSLVQDHPAIAGW
eukprot:COSAG02_NODE_9309_length_2259_cov_3.884722_2_plen_149_part_00